MTDAVHRDGDQSDAEREAEFERAYEEEFERAEVVEVRAPVRDHILLQMLGEQLAAGGSERQRLREALGEALARSPRGGILATLLASPLVGVELDLSRDGDYDRVVEF